ncbi:uncharacterized protein TNCV_3873521 [Trichonephila clavipes]|nr:uncharacterized protein TNCV_3873521 [Trichonephila clavipes]
MGIMMGYAQRTKGYRIWLIDENKLVETINFQRQSTEMPSTSEKPDVPSDNHSLIPCTEVKWIRNIGRKAGRRALLLARWVVRSVPLKIVGSSRTREVTHARKTGSGATRKTMRRDDQRIVRQALVDPTVTRSTIRADTLPWPVRSPDLSPVEHVWDQLIRQMLSCYSVHDLELAVQDSWPICLRTT